MSKSRWSIDCQSGVENNNSAATIDLRPNSYRRSGMKSKIILYLVLTCAFIRSVAAQEVTPAIKVAAFPYKDSIALRWAPTDAATWQLINKYGYVLERYTLTRDNQRITPEMIALARRPVKPRPLGDWENQIDDDDYMAIAAQAIYGSSFETSGNYNSDVLQIINQVKELEQRYSFALFAADLSRKVARWTALGYIDKDIKKNEKYVYKIYAAVPSNLLKIDTGYVFTGVEDFRELPRPIQLKAESGDKAILLSWDRRYYTNIYIAYHVDRSDDGGKTYQQITKLPLINSDPPEGLPADRMYKLDSLQENGKTYLYRVRGLTSFGDIGPASEMVAGQGTKKFEANPAIVKAEVIEGQAVSILWDFPKGLLKEVSGYRVQRAPKASGEYQNLTESLIPATTNSFIDRSPRASNYYKIVVEGKQGQKAFSFPYLVQLEDSIPPSPPMGLIAKIDNHGVVQINWKQNKEDDFLGYRVFRANYKGDEYGQITTSPVPRPEFIDTVAVKTLSNKVYYKVTSLDHRYNSSEFSEVIEVKRPDVTPPAPPAFKNYRASEESVFIAWSPSPSRDVMKHTLWRKDQTQVARFIKEFPSADTTRTYSDVTASAGVLYEYVIEAEDSAGLKSRNAVPLKAKRIDNGVALRIEQFKGEADRLNNLIKLSWRYAPSNVRKFMIYRAEDTAPISLYYSVNANDKKFDDANTKVNTRYKYRVKAVLSDGTESPFSDEVLVEF